MIKKNKKRARCGLDECREKIALIIGECKYCENKFCLKHRLPEDHLCVNLSKKKFNDRSKVENKLLSEKCVNIKLAKF